jgi:aerotaxis receptor
LQGNINYANPYFIEVSGFTEEELIGAPQNVRHPDMPVEAFADLWSTIKSGMPWTGLVKNRCKNGDFYWVLANVTPVIESGKPVGYLSVRTKPSREQVRAADALPRNQGRQSAQPAHRQWPRVSTGIGACARCRACRCRPRSRPPPCWSACWRCWRCAVRRWMPPPARAHNWLGGASSLRWGMLAGRSLYVNVALPLRGHVRAHDGGRRPDFVDRNPARR